ncbi:ribosome-recycling factor, mitochondrial-like [Dreissena polymorpha]|uniref:ribosome-recycling factor, mitochondrial-like n=1 Tax=Dreissena polymorpha TaxID=45954 RepID=UPI002265657F|nr:ribosome-recycling factor, mitochondrial-like [Dreissena polymorpha]
MRTNIGMYGKLQVKTPDGSFPLNQIASIIQKTPSLVVVNLAKNSHYIAEVLSTLRNSGMNLNPQQEGQSLVYLTIPKVSREHREQLAKNAKAIFNKTKDSLNKVYSKFSKKTSSINREDEKQLADKKLLAMKNAAQVAAEKQLKAKTEELLKTLD